MTSTCLDRLERPNTTPNTFVFTALILWAFYSMLSTKQQSKSTLGIGPFVKSEQFLLTCHY